MKKVVEKIKIEAYLNSYNEIEVVTSEEVDNLNIELYLKEENIPLELSFKCDKKYIYKVSRKLELGNDYIIRNNITKDFRLDVTRAVDFKDFDIKYTYFQDDLGPTYHKEYTDFVLWAPLCYKVELKITNNGKTKKHIMERSDNGTYRITLKGDYDGALYNYIVHLNNSVNEVIDPYAKSSNANGKMSAVVDLSKLEEIKFSSDKLPPFKENVEAIIYELHVRDFTIHRDSNIVHKGKFLGLAESGRTTKGGHPAGLDYLKYIGITHVQLLPVLDYKTVDEENPEKTYNWGYDPQQYFALEGSFSLSPNNPYSRMMEFRKLVKAFHENGLRVNLDVVYNHVYEVTTSSFQNIVPFYYFRHTSDYKFIEHSFCGDDIATERPMVKKLIVDSIRFLIKTYDVDGFRFDLMGLMDVRTIKEAERNARAMKPNIMFYGEGWDMFAEPRDKTPCAHMNNAHLLPTVGFFNDRFRNIARGPGGATPLEDTGYLLGNTNYYDGFKFIFLGSVLDVTFPHLFVNLNQSINYMECHDNGTILDAIETSTNDTIDEMEQRIKMMNKVILFSFGVPFIHNGQEFGLTKFGSGNTYNKGDRYNQFDYGRLDKCFSLVESFAKYARIRKKIPFYRITDPEVLKRVYDFNRIDDSMFIRLEDKTIDEKTYYLAINPNKKTVYHTFKSEVEQLIKDDNPNSNIIAKNAMIFPNTMKIYIKKERE